MLKKFFKKSKIEESETENSSPRSESEGVKNFTKEMVSALATALIFIVYVIQAFTIPTGSMEKSLLVGDFLLGLKFIYGAPVIPSIPKVWDSYLKFPGLTSPKQGDVVIFKYPGHDNKDYIKRCVAVAGETVEVHGKKLYVNDQLMVNPPHSQYIKDGKILPEVNDFPKLYIPKAGDTLDIANAPIREFIYYKHLIHQEHPRSKMSEKFTLFADGEDYSDSLVNFTNGSYFKFSAINFKLLDSLSDWTIYSRYFSELNTIFPTKSELKVKKELFIDGEPVTYYVVKKNCYFMMGDNRDNSLDSRFWGFVDANFIKAKAFIVYFSLDKKVPFYLLPIKIRWNRLGMLIRGWDGVPKEDTKK